MVLFLVVRQNLARSTIMDLGVVRRKYMGFCLRLAFEQAKPAANRDQVNIGFCKARMEQLTEDMESMESPSTQSLDGELIAPHMTRTVLITVTQLCLSTDVILTHYEVSMF